MRGAITGAEFERLYTEHADGLLSFLTYEIGDRSLAEDVVADTFERVLRARSRRGGRSSETTWIYAIAINLARRDGAEARALGPVAAGSGAPGELGDRDVLRRGLQILSGEERIVVALRFGGDLALAEIADLLEERQSTIEGRLHRGLRRLRDGLPEDVREIADRLSAARAAFTAAELDALNSRLRGRFEHAPRRKSLLASMRAKALPGLLALGLALTLGAGVVIASSAIGGGKDTFRTTRLDDANDASTCQLNGSHEELSLNRTEHRRLLIIVTFDCQPQRVIVHIDFDGAFGFAFDDGQTHRAHGSWTGDAPSDSLGLTVSVGRSRYQFPLSWLGRASSARRQIEGPGDSPEGPPAAQSDLSGVRILGEPHREAFGSVLCEPARVVHLVAAKVDRGHDEDSRVE